MQRNLSLPLPQPGVTAQLITPTGQGDLLYLLVNQPAPPATPDFKMAVYDLSLSPVALVTSVDAMVGHPMPTGGILKIFGNTLFDGWDVFDVSDKIPVRLGTIPYPIGDVNSDHSLAVSGRGILDIAQPANSTIRAVLDDGFHMQDSSWVGNLLYSAEYTGGLAIYSATTPGGQIPLGTLSAGGVHGYTLDQVVDGATLYTAQQSDVGPMVAIYNLSGGSPTMVGTYREAGQHSLSLALVGKVLFVGTAEGLLLLDVSSPSSPAKIGFMQVPALSLATAGNYLFAGTNDNHLVVLDVSNPKSPSQVAQLALPDTPIALCASGNLLLVADNTTGLLIYGISNASSPVLMSQLKLTTAVFDVTMDGNMALLAAGGSGLVILDLKNPTTPIKVSQTGVAPFTCLPGCMNPGASSIAVYGGLAYLGTFGTAYGKVFGFDYKAPAHPRLVSSWNYGGALEEWVLNFAFDRSKMFVGGEFSYPYIGMADISQPRNVIIFTIQNSRTEADRSTRLLLRNSRMQSTRRSNLLFGSLAEKGALPH